MRNLQIQMIPAPKGMKWARSVTDTKTSRTDQTFIMFPNVYALRTVRDLGTNDEWTEVMDSCGEWQRLGDETVGNFSYSSFIGIDIDGWDKDAYGEGVS